jgi:hypothetical protein
MVAMGWMSFLDDSFFLVWFVSGEIGAIWWAMEFLFSELPAAETADGLAQGRTESFGFSLVASCAFGHFYCCPGLFLQSFISISYG